MLEEHADDQQRRHRFVLEGEITGGLEHPGVVPVYGLGSFSDGRPFYAMRFIRGDSLNEAINRFHGDEGVHLDPARRSLELRKLLRRFVDVCNTIDYAHSRGILHRDIKPGNVIVGKYGQTLVVDWGLAKATGKSDPSTGERTLMPRSAGDLAETLPGSAPGTPAYMSPEQAAGELDRLGPRSDVYSLGATLYCLLTGKRPFEGDDVGVLLRLVQEGKFPPPRARVPSIDRPLEAVCLKAMALKPEDRYETPRALADDVERWMADAPVSAWREPWTRMLMRWLTRHRVPVTAAAAALIVALMGLVAVAAVQAQAHRELNSAYHQVQARYGLAMDAIRTFHTGVSEDFLLKEEQFKDLRNKLLRGAAEFYGKLEAMLDERQDRSSQAALARAYVELAALTAKIGKTDEALAVYSKALAVRRALASEPGTDVETRLDMARTMLDKGRLQEDSGDRASSLLAYQEARDLVERLEATEGPADKIRALRGAALVRIGMVLADTGKPADALATYERARAIFEELAAINPSVTQFQRDLAATHGNIGNLLKQTGKPIEARHPIARDWRSSTSSPSPTPLRPSSSGIWRSATTTSGFCSTRRAGRTRRWPHTATRRRSGRSWPTTAPPSPSSSGTCRKASTTLHSCSSRRANRMPRWTEFGRVQEILERLVAANPTLTDPQFGLGLSYMNSGGVLSSAGRTEEAVAAARKALACFEKLAGAGAESHEVQVLPKHGAEQPRRRPAEIWSPGRGPGARSTGGADSARAGTDRAAERRASLWRGRGGGYPRGHPQPRRPTSRGG